MGSLLIPAGSGRHWKHRAIEATGANTSLLGCFVLAICGWQHGRHPPRFGSKAIINKEGIVFSNLQDKDGRMYRAHCLGHVDTITHNFRGLAEHLKLSDEDRVDMFAELRKWFSHDARANETNEKRGLQQ